MGVNISEYDPMHPRWITRQGNDITVSDVLKVEWSPCEDRIVQLGDWHGPPPDSVPAEDGSSRAIFLMYGHKLRIRPNAVYHVLRRDCLSVFEHTYSERFSDDEMRILVASLINFVETFFKRRFVSEETGRDETLHASIEVHRLLSKFNVTPYQLKVWNFDDLRNLIQRFNQDDRSEVAFFSTFRLKLLDSEE